MGSAECKPTFRIVPAPSLPALLNFGPSSPPALGLILLAQSSRNRQLCPVVSMRSKEHHMAHWRKSYPPTSQFNHFAGWMIGASMLVGALVFIARHVHV
jgi:hypothetical protein